jgi:hypothetical protein
MSQSLLGSKVVRAIGCLLLSLPMSVVALRFYGFGFFLGLLLHNIKPPAIAVAAKMMTTHTTGSRSIPSSLR